MAKKKTASKKKNQKSPSFEESLSGLEEIVGELEAGNLPLSEAIEKYENGVKLLKQCHGALESVQRKIELLTNVDANGKETAVGFDDQGTPVDQPGRGGQNLADLKENVESEDGSVDESGRLF